MATQIRLRASITIFIAAVVVAVALTPLFAGDSSAAGPASADIAVVAIDADSSGNEPDTVGSIEECVSASVDQPVEVDIVVPSPGIPVDRGIAAFQLRLFYDPAIVWVTADDSSQLLAQATGSTVIAFSDVAITGQPNTSGDYLSVAVDFGPKGIEPAGASETGPGVLARLTLLPKSEGTSTLFLSEVDIRDDQGDKIMVGSIQDGTIVVGGLCAEPSQNTILSPDNDDSGDSGENGDGGDNGASDVAAATAAPSPELPAEVPNGGGPPPRVGGTSAWFVLGLIATLGGASLLIAGELTFRGRTRRDRSPGQD